MIIFWTYSETQNSWIENSNAFVALNNVLESGGTGSVLLTTQQPEKDKETICAVLHIIKKMHADATVIVGIPHASIELFELFSANGANNIWVVNLIYPASSVKPYLDIKDKFPVNSSICPALHIKQGDPVELSVCGKRNNRLILVMRHYRKWCIAGYKSCPYWRGEYAP